MEKIKGRPNAKETNKILSFPNKSNSRETFTFYVGVNKYDFSINI